MQMLRHLAWMSALTREEGEAEIWRLLRKGGYVEAFRDMLDDGGYSKPN
jgi:hypothetical protein